jgi:hypothetical protein
MHESNPVVGGLLFIALAIVFNVGCVFWGLKQTASQNGYLQQLLAAAGIGLVAGVLIFVFSFLMLTVLMPDYLEQSKSPVGEATGGLIGTFFTSLIVGAIVGIFLRKK